MATTNLNIRTDKAIKDQAEEIFNELGLNMTTAVNMFLRTAITVQLRKAEQHGETKSLSVGDLVLDMVSLSLTVQEQPVKLTRTEYAILKLLMENPKQVISKSVLLDRISLDTPDCTERSLKQHISNLRKKMQDVSGVDYIETVWGIGFKLAEQKILTKS